MTAAVCDRHPLTGRRGAGSRGVVRRSFELAEHFTDHELDRLGQLAAAAYGDEYVDTIADRSPTVTRCPSPSCSDHAARAGGAAAPDDERLSGVRYASARTVTFAGDATGAQIDRALRRSCPFGVASSAVLHDRLIVHCRPDADGEYAVISDGCLRRRPVAVGV